MSDIDDMRFDQVETAKEIPKNIQFYELLGKELTIASIIHQRLEQNLGSETSLILLDVGGMLSMSWLRLAKHFEQQVYAGRVLFVSTSLGVTIDDLIDRIEGWHYKRGPLKNRRVDFDSANQPPYFSELELDFIKNNKHLVVSAKQDLPDLLKMEVDGHKLLGHVALICDSFAVSVHSRVPSVHLPLLATLLDEKGVFMSFPESTVAISKEDNHISRTVELERARKILELEFGLERVINIEGGSPELQGLRLSTVFLRKPNGPRINAYVPRDRLLFSASSAGAE